MVTIRVFHSHIEVYPYKKGDCNELEKSLSKYDTALGYYIPMGYFIQNDILYLPKGVNTTKLELWFESPISIVNEYDNYTRIKKGVAIYPPRDDIQENGIKFLTGTDDYVYTTRYSQLGLNMNTGDGKTYTTVTAILKMKIKAIIITHQEKIKEQWINTFLEKTSLPEDSICNISSSSVMDEIMAGNRNCEIYLINHQTIQSYASVHGWTKIRDFFKKIKVGIKVIDEAHKYFENTLMIDFFSNCYKSFYLTATFGRSDPSEIRVYKTSFNSLVRYGEETFDEKRKHIKFIIVYYKSKPMFGISPNVRSSYGFSAYKYIDYQLKNEENHSLMKVVHKIIEQTSNLEGKTLILSPKKESVKFIAKDILEFTNEEVGTIFSDNSDKVNEENKEKRFICSTAKSAGEGVDIPGLRILIDLEPVASQLLADQIRGRLREYSPNEDTFLFYPVDLSVKESSIFLKKILPIMKKKCKEIITMRMEV